MSLILEALRKSEAERRRGRAPDLATELPPPAPLRRIRVPTWPWLLAAALLLLPAAWWLAGPRPDHVAGPPAEPADATTPATPAAASTVAATGDAAFPRIERIAPPPATAAAVAPATTGHETPATGNGTATGAPAQPRPQEPAAVVATPSPPPPATPTASPPAPPVRNARPSTLAELPAEERRRLPALKLSMHMWNPQPAKRFVILDGIRYGEGDRIGAAVITAIDSDGVILDLDGRAVRLPLP